MSDIYTTYVEELGSGETPEPEPARVEEICRRLRRDLRQAMVERSLWRASPSLVGAVGSSWSEDVLDDLVHDAYLYNFADRLRHLHARARLGVELGPLVRRNLRHFLSERQQAADPIGRRIFVRLRAALRGAVAGGRLHLLHATPGERERLEIGQLTLLGFRRGFAVVAPRERLAEAVRGWAEDLVTGLIRAETNAVAGVVERLERAVLGLERAGVEAFHFKDLAALVQRRARRRWEADVARDLGEAASERGAPDAPSVPVLVVRPDDEPDGGRRLLRLVRCVSRRIAALEDRRTGEQLARLWQTVRSLGARGLPRPSLSQLSRELSIPRERRLPRLLGQLGEMVERCRECQLAPPAECRAERTRAS